MTRITDASLLEWRAPYESGAQAVLLRAAARCSDEMGVGFLSLWFYESDGNDLILYATTQDLDAGDPPGRPSTSTTSENGGEG